MLAIQVGVVVGLKGVLEDSQVDQTQPCFSSMAPQTSVSVPVGRSWLAIDVLPGRGLNQPVQTKSAGGVDPRGGS